jgi:16S rRNA (cytidine1402-2'-O)-methyltransferase
MQSLSQAERQSLVQIRQWYNKAACPASQMSGTLFVVATPIGNLEDITIRALRILRDVSLIAAEDTRRTRRLLSRYAIGTETTSLHEHNESHKIAGLIARLQSGDSIAIVSDAGTPTISDPGMKLIGAAIDCGLRVEPIPGPSAVLSTLAASGMSIDAFVFLGFPPTKQSDREKWFAELKSAAHPVVFFEAPHRVRRTLTEILEAVGDKPLVVGRELTKVHEEFLRGPVSSVLERLKSPIGEFTLVLDIGRKTQHAAAEALLAADIVTEFGLMTNDIGLSKRLALSKLARKHGLSTNAAYAAVEQAKKSAK